jgi:hypothetical protein
VKFINLAFQLGVVFAIFSFLWGIFQFLLNLLRMGQKQSVTEYYIWKFIQYFFLVNVTVLFSVQKESSSMLLINELILSGFVLALYFAGKLQSQQSKEQFFAMQGNRPMFKTLFNQKAEIFVIGLSILCFALFIIYPEYARNVVSVWFYESILDIDDTPVFGFIFKIIGFFVLLGILFKLVNGFFYLLSGAPLVQMSSSFSRKNKEDEFDDFEEMKE